MSWRRERGERERRGRAVARERARGQGAKGGLGSERGTERDSSGGEGAAGQDGRRRDTHHVNNTLLRRKTEPTSLVSPLGESPSAHPTSPTHPPYFLAAAFPSTTFRQPASQPVWTIFTRTMMRSLAAIFPGFLPPLAVINATIPCHQKGKRPGRVAREHAEGWEFTDRGESSTRRGHCWRGRNSVKCLRKLR